jgi:hypothetical protein
MRRKKLKIKKMVVIFFSPNSRCVVDEVKMLSQSPGLSEKEADANLNGNFGLLDSFLSFITTTCLHTAQSVCEFW